MAGAAEARARCPGAAGPRHACARRRRRRRAGRRSPARARRRGSGRARSRGRRSRITLSTPALASKAPSSRPAGPAPTIATCVRRAAVTALSLPPAVRARARAARPRGRGVSLPRRRGSSAGGRPSSITAATVCSSGRVVSRVCSARWMSTREWPRFSASCEGSQSGSSLHGSTLLERGSPRPPAPARRGGAALLGFVLAGGDQLAPAAGRAARRPGAVEGAARRRARPGGRSRRRGRARR